jgi:outer membrane protein OmpA-like peptidoglycan-associated protein
VTAKGDSGYYSSRKNSIGGDDIFSIALPQSARPQALVMVRGRVLDIETRLPLEAQVVYETLAEGRAVGTARSAPSNGEYRIALNGGEQYAVRAEADGYYPLSESLDARKLGEYEEQVKDLLMSPIKMNVAIRLNNVFFDSGKFDLRSESFPELDRLVSFLKKNATVRIEIAGHTDNIGADKDNATLSQNRVNSVMQYVVSKGIAASRLTAMGFGEARPVASNDTEEGRQQNRRVEFTIVQK